MSSLTCPCYAGGSQARRRLLLPSPNSTPPSSRLLCGSSKRRSSSNIVSSNKRPMLPWPKPSLLAKATSMLWSKEGTDKPQVRARESCGSTGIALKSLQTSLAMMCVSDCSSRCLIPVCLMPTLAASAPRCHGLAQGVGPLRLQNRSVPEFEEEEETCGCASSEWLLWASAVRRSAFTMLSQHGPSLWLN